MARVVVAHFGILHDSDAVALVIAVNVASRFDCGRNLSGRGRFATTIGSERTAGTVAIGSPLLDFQWLRAGFAAEVIGDYRHSFIASPEEAGYAPLGSPAYRYCAPENGT